MQQGISTHVFLPRRHRRQRQRDLAQGAVVGPLGLLGGRERAPGVQTLGDGVETVGGSPEIFASFQRSEYEKWAKFVKETKISFEE